MRNQSGQSLIQVLVSVAIMAVVLTAMSSMFSNLNRESKAMSEKLGAMDLEKVLIASLADGGVCMYLLTEPTPVKFVAANPMTKAAPQVLDFSGTPTNPGKVYSSYDSSSKNLGPIIAQVGQPASPVSGSLIVSKISLELIDRQVDTVTGLWRIDFDSSRLARAIRPAYATVTLKVDVATQTFKSCQGNAAGTGGGGGGARSGEWCGGFIGHMGNGFAMEIYKVISECNGHKLSCPTGYTWNGQACMSFPSPFPIGMPTSQACPSGYKLETLLESIDAASGNPHTLFTCMPN